MGFAVCHILKGKGSGGATGNHVDREPGKEHSYKNADPARIGANEHLQKEADGKLYWRTKAQDKPLELCIKERIKEGYTGAKKIRTDAVKYLQIVLSGSHEDMKRIDADPEAYKKWKTANYKFIVEKYGRENIMRFTAHRDERTTHIHAIIVPLTEDGRLSAKEVMGDRNALQELQNDYARRMEPFGLERGLKSTGVTHRGIKEYYAMISSAWERIPAFPDLTDQEVRIIQAAHDFKVENPPKFCLNPQQWASDQTAKHANLLTAAVAVYEKHDNVAKHYAQMSAISINKVEDEKHRLQQTAGRKIGVLKHTNLELTKQLSGPSKDQGVDRGREI